VGRLRHVRATSRTSCFSKAYRTPRAGPSAAVLTRGPRRAAPGESARASNFWSGCRRSPSPAPLALRNGWLELPIPMGLAEGQRPRYARAALIDWYRRLAGERLPADVAHWAQKLDVAPPVVIVSEQERRWGSCSKGVVRLNWRIMQAPKSVIEYVVAHEVTHLIHEDHSRAFWAALGRVMPDYEVRKAGLRDLGPGFVW
jgi:hypothetical protein